MADDPTQPKTLEMRVAELEDKISKLQAPAAVGQAPVCACAMAAPSVGMAPVCACAPHPAAYVCACVPHPANVAMAAHPAAYVCACVCAAAVPVGATAMVCACTNVCACMVHPAALVCACTNVCACVSTSAPAAPGAPPSAGQNPPSPADFGKLGS